MNVVNFTDGADGLAAGVHDRAATFAVIALSLDRVDAACWPARRAAAAEDLWHNFHPASIFMGDAGSNLLGLLLAAVAIQVLKTAAVVALLFPLLTRRRRSTPPSSSRSGSSTGAYLTPLALSPPLREHLLAAAYGALSVRLDASPRRSRLRCASCSYSDDDGTLNAGWTLVIAAFDCSPWRRACTSYWCSRSSSSGGSASARSNVRLTPARSRR